MATEDDNKDGRTETNAVESPTMALNWKDKLENRFRDLKEHAETYPYVWASYIVVYGGFAVWTTYRWRKLRKTEDRVRALQERLRKIVEEQEGGGGGGAASVDWRCIDGGMEIWRYG
ncbi:hypothetical protein Syun_016598 [Stephania yunnanensis]|uniref:Transmembrane protein n=1 Tax=Stephania yunnanensis TaxID=152371 RepID=A0AAP0J7S8_9MAGN